MFPINFILETVPIDVIWLLKMTNQLGLVSYPFYNWKKLDWPPKATSTAHPAMPAIQGCHKSKSQL